MNAPASHTGRKNVLFVDTDVDFLEQLQSSMEQLSDGAWNVIVSADSASALTALSSHSLDLAVLDSSMQLVNGVHLLQIVHRKHPQLKKVVLSGAVDDVTRAAALVGGAELALAKPQDPAHYQLLFKALNDLLLFQADQFRGAHRKADDDAGGKSGAPAMTPMPAPAVPTVNEVVVCSGAGDVLYAAQSTNAEERGTLCRDLLQSAARLESLLPLGPLERIEFISTSGRMLMRAQDSHAVFLHASDA
jgi:CheY-like chemotaxis protein